MRMLPPKAKITAEVWSGREPPEARPRQIEIEDGISELPGDDDADQKARHAPEHGGDDAGADHAVGIARLIARLLLLDDLSEDIEEGESRRAEQHAAMEGDDRILAGNRQDQPDESEQRRRRERRKIRKRFPLLAFEHSRHGLIPFRRAPCARASTLNFDEDQEIGVAPTLFRQPPIRRVPMLLRLPDAR